MSRLSALAAIGLAGVLVIPAASNGVILDMAGMKPSSSAAPFLAALDDQGKLWLHSADCLDESWRHVDTIPGAIAFDWNDSNGVIIREDGTLLRGQLYSEVGPFSVAATIPMPMTDAVDVGIGPESQSHFWVRCSSGEFWYLNVGTSSHHWYGPCSGPPGSVAVIEDSWGSVKQRYSR